MFIFTEILHVLDKIIIKNTVLVLVYDNNIIRVCKINFPINRPTITDTNTTKMWLIKPILIINR